MMPEALAELHSACFTTPRPWGAAEFRDLLARPDTMLLTEAGGFLLGSAVMDDAEVLTLAVDPAHRRQGNARRLLQRFHEAARTSGAQRCLLEVGEDNHGARALYADAGYRQIGRRRAYYRTPAGGDVDALVLERALR